MELRYDLPDIFSIRPVERIENTNARWQIGRLEREGENMAQQSIGKGGHCAKIAVLLLWSVKF